MKYKQIYTSSIFNIQNNIDISKNTIFINVFTNEDYEIFNEINDKIVIYNNELHFFNYLEIIKKVILLDVPIYSDNVKIREYLFDNGKLSAYIINMKELSKKVIEEAAHKKVIEEAARKKVIEEAAHKKVIEEAAHKKVIEEAAHKKVISSIFLFGNDNSLIYI
jgi:hypothetical protein